MNVPRLPFGVLTSQEADSIYQRDLNRYLNDQARTALATSAGTWIPSLVSDGTAPAVTYGTNNRARWARVGPLVMLSGQLNVTAISGGTGNAQLGNLPFTCATDVGAKGGLIFGNVSGFSSTTTPRAAVPLITTTVAPLWRASSADARDALNTQVTVAECVAPVIFFHGLYFI